MRIFIATDLHGEEVACFSGASASFIVGDFSNGEKLRELVFDNGKIEDAKTEILKSSQKFLESLPCGSIIVPGNVEKLCLDEISKIARTLGHHFLENNVLNLENLKVVGLKFFMEEEWAKNTYPNDKDKIKRAKNEEGEVRDFLEANPDADIVLSHLPPYKILDEDLDPPKIIQKNYSKNCGSKVLLEYIKKNQPKLVVCGHIHIPGEVIIGRTRVINPGKGKLISI